LAEAFFSASHLLRRAVNGRFLVSDLTLARLKVLSVLSLHDKIRMGELSQWVDVAPRTMTSTVEGLEREGLVTRTPDPVDGRATVVSITDTGLEKCKEGRRVHAGVVADVFAVLSDEQKRVLAEALENLATAARKAAEPGG
jgi:DNA-binding MarR family transcriptional regulator